MAKKKRLPIWAITVTPFSKMLALSMFIVFPILGFYYGISYQKNIDAIKEPIKEIVMYKNVCAQPQDGKIRCNANVDCPVNYSCIQAGPIRADRQNHKTCWKNGHAIPL